MAVGRAAAAGAHLIHRSALLTSFRLGWQASLDPAAEAALEREGRRAVLTEKLRHTGAGGLVGSRAVGDDLALARQLAIAALDVLGRHAD